MYVWIANINQHCVATLVSTICEGIAEVGVGGRLGFSGKVELIY